MLSKSLPLSNSYQSIRDFANSLDKETNLRAIYNFADILVPIGFNINEISLSEWNSLSDKKNINGLNFVNIKEYKNIELNICKIFPEDLKRVLYAQAMANYLLHSSEGKNPCYIKSPSEKTLVNQESLIFALALLMPDMLFLDLYGRETNESIAKLFRVPLKMVEIKKALIKNSM